VFETSDVAMVWGDLASGRIIRGNPACARFTGYGEDELAGKRMAELLVPEDGERDIATLAEFLEGSATSHTSESRYLRKDGEMVWGLRSVTAVREDGRPRYAFAVIQDINERKKARAEVAYLATHDALTGAANRLVFQSTFADAIAGRAAHGLVAVLYIDLDNFKDINDTLGHATGDATLREIAQRLREAVAPDDLIARIGGDEFAILRKHAATSEEVRRLAADLIERMAAPYAVGDNVVRQSSSIGISLGPIDGLDADELVRKADIALRTAKETGRGSYRFFELAMESRLVERQALKIDLSAALSNNELDIVYQPVLDIHSGKVSSFEALLRWHHPRRGLLLPAEFIPLAEETGLIAPIGEWIIARACAEAMTWPPHISVAVNVSSAQFRNNGFALRVADALGRAGLKPSHLELEITESLLLHGSESNLRILRDLRSLGVRIALDDFGTGYSSLGYLQQFPFDRIKIDRSFVNDVTERDEAKAVITALIGLGHSLNMRITAEGVETEAQLDSITARGCDEVQGYLFSAPVPAADIPAVIARLENHPAGARALSA
jgi:diguanylate cyclase (GGDEF)-like protein/PAS domain S-box-containing protein